MTTVVLSTSHYCHRSCTWSLFARSRTLRSIVSRRITEIYFTMDHRQMKYTLQCITGLPHRRSISARINYRRTIGPWYIVSRRIADRWNFTLCVFQNNQSKIFADSIVAWFINLYSVQYLLKWILACQKQLQTDIQLIVSGIVADRWNLTVDSTELE